MKTLLNDVPVGFGRPAIPEGTKVILNRPAGAGAWWVTDPQTGDEGVAFEEELS